MEKLQQDQQTYKKLVQGIEYRIKLSGHENTTPPDDLISSMSKVRINIQEYIDPDLVLRSASSSARKTTNNNFRSNK